MNGQWIGTYSGTNQGTITVNVDELRDKYGGIAYINDERKQLPCIAAFFETPNQK